MPVNHRGAGQDTAPFKINGYAASNAHWIDTLNVSVDGAVIHDDADIWTWQLNFAKDPHTIDLSLTTTAGDLTVTNGADATSIAIDVSYEDLSAMEGDYYAVLAYQTAGGDRIKFAEGVFTFNDSAVWSG